MLNSEILILNDNNIITELENKSHSNKTKSSINFLTNNTIDSEFKNEILFLINSGYDRHKIMKVYLLLKPKNINEAVYFLSKYNNLYQHIFYPSKTNNCEICGGKKEEHIKININPKNSIINTNEENDSFENQIKNENITNICKVCEEGKEKDKINKCKYCKEILCNDCYYKHFQESILSAKNNIKCPNCDNILKEGEIIQKLYETSEDEKTETLKLINIYKKYILRFEILKDKNIRFCPIKDCDSYAKKEDDIFVECGKGHKFCFNCGKPWHKNKNCENKEEIDELFEEYKKKLNAKECPNCKINSYKTKGCNHINCTYCNVHWCWICKKQIEDVEEHYNDPKNECYSKMFDDNFNSNNICSKCLNEFENLTKNDNCEHFICDNCFINLVENLNIDTSIKEKISSIKCPIEGCEKGIINYEKLLNYLNIHNKDLYKVIKRNIARNFNFSIKNKFDYVNLLNNEIFNFFSYIIGFQCIYNHSSSSTFFCEILLFILIIFQLIIIAPFFGITSVIVNFQIITRELYYHEIKKFMELLGYNYIIYLNFIMFEILNVVNFFQIIMINIVYILVSLIISFLNNI